MRTTAWLGALIVAAALPLRADTTGDRMLADVEYLADDAREGRLAPSDGHADAAAMIEARFAELGLSPAFGGGYRQSFGDDTAYTNVVARLDGVVDEAIVVGAHFDHLGIDENGNVFNGADDNASGVAMLLELARALSASPPRGRTIVFAAFDGEEQGLLGSNAYVSASPPPAAMLNLDSVGRLRDRRLLCLGAGTGDVFSDMLDGVSRVFDIDLAVSKPVHPAGDHLPFFRAGVPTLHFFTDGHPQYHRVTDTSDLVTADGLRAVYDVVHEVVRYLADPAVVVRFVPSGAEAIAAPETPRRQRTVSFGTIPDFARESGGLLVSGVIPGSAAADAGIVVGDLIVDIDGSAIDNLYDYQAVLAEHDPGDEIRVTFRRGDAEETVIATLRARR